MQILTGHEGTVTALTFSPDGRLLASASKDRTVWIWESPASATVIRDHVGEMWSLAFTPDSRSLLTGGKDGRAFHTSLTNNKWQPAELAQRLTSADESATVTGLHVFNSKPWTVVTATGGVERPSPGGVRIIDWGDRTHTRFVDTDPDGIATIACLESPRLLAWATGNRQVKVRDLSKADSIPFPQANRVRALAFTPNGSQLAVAADWKIRVFDLQTRRPRSPLEGHKGIVSSLAYHPHGHLLMSGGWDETVRLWDAETGAPRGRFKWPIGKVFTVAFAPDGLRAAAAGSQGQICVWDFDE